MTGSISLPSLPPIRLEGSVQNPLEKSPDELNGPLGLSLVAIKKETINTHRK